MIVRLCAILLCLLPYRVFSAEPAGLWALRAGSTAIFRLELHEAASGWFATWSHPRTFDIDGDSFRQVDGPVVQRTSQSAREQDGWIELRFAGPSPDALPDIFRLHAIDSDHAEVRFNGARLGTLTFVRERPAAPFGKWDPHRTYTVVQPRDDTSNGEMTALFDADQKARNSGGAIDWHVIGAEDRQRRARTQALLDAGALHSGDDFYHAAFVFQHGSMPDDFLKAHLLATASAARGNAAAIWISAATLDRYLHAIGQPQVMGTQFEVRDGKASQEPYARTVASDALRDALRVPPLREQETQRQLYEDSARNRK